jgi:L-asparaginase/Glu-tRNA(Gln) amidotransferase subunit D
MEREVLVVATRGTIAMREARAVPAAGASELLAAVGLDRVEARALLGVPGAHVGLADALQVARTAAAEAFAADDP